ncbi:hypothetical protein D3C84_466090 [compost metagenome]
MLPARRDGGSATTFEQRLERQNQIPQANQEHMPAQPQQAVVLAEVQQLAFDLHPGYLPTDRVEFNHRFGAFTTDMYHRGMRVKNHLPTGLFDAFAVVNFLVVKEVARVEQAHLVDDFPANQVIAPGHPVAFTDRVVIPFHVVDPLHHREKALKPCTGKEDIQRRGEIAAGGLQVAFASDQPNAKHAAIRMSLHVFEGFVQGVGGNEGIGIEE